MVKDTIEIDCDPWTGMGRQQSHYEAVCALVGATPQSRISACFGCWEWPIDYGENRDQKREKVKEFLTDLYNKSLIRYASW